MPIELKSFYLVDLFEGMTNNVVAYTDDNSQTWIEHFKNLKDIFDNLDTILCLVGSDHCDFQGHKPAVIEIWPES